MHPNSTSEIKFIIGNSDTKTEILVHVYKLFQFYLTKNHAFIHI